MLMSQLEGQENRIRLERNRYNDQVKDFNARIRSLPLQARSPVAAEACPASRNILISEASAGAQRRTCAESKTSALHPMARQVPGNGVLLRRTRRQVRLRSHMVRQGPRQRIKKTLCLF